MTLYSCADKALYHVKRNGKNFFHFYGAGLEYGDEQTVDIQYLHELLSRADAGKGAYQLNIESFQYVFNFIRRSIKHSKAEVATVLFTISETEDVRAMEILEKTAAFFLRRQDVLTRYSGRQLMVILPYMTETGAVTYAENIIEKFETFYTGDPVRIDYAISHIDNR